MSAGGFEYLDEVSRDSGGNRKKLSNLQVDQTGMEAAPSEGGEGYVGGNPNASSVGFDYVEGKKGYSKDQPIWSTESSWPLSAKDNSGTGDASITNAGTDSTDEKASYKKVQTDEGLPQTYRDSKGAGDAGPSGSDEPDQTGGEFPGNSNQGHPDTQDVGEGTMSDMPQTEFTENEGGGAPKFKHSGS